MNLTARRRSLLALRACGDGPHLPQLRLKCFAAFEYLITGRKKSDLRQIRSGALIEALEALRLEKPEKFAALSEDDVENRILNRMKKAVKAFKRETKCGITAPSSTNSTRKRNGQEPYAPIFRERANLHRPIRTIVGDSVHGFYTRGLAYDSYEGDEDSPYTIEMSQRDRDAITYFHPFTPLQQSAIKLLWDGFSQKQTADILGIPLCRVKAIKAELAERAGVASLMRRSA
jgi:DNA-directed RNA polymerase specialized sigma subunit